MSRQKLNEDVRSTLTSLPILEGVDDRALRDLVSIAHCHDYPKSNILYYEGDPAHATYLVVTGRVKLTLMNEEGREVVLSMVGPGGMFGLISALDGGPEPTNAITAASSRLAKFDSEAFFAWLDGQERVREALLREMGWRVREAYQKIGEHALMGVKERLLYALLDIAESEGKPGPDGEGVIFTRPTHQELANRIGSSREVVSRVLKELLESELLQAEGRVIRVPESALIVREE